MKLSTLTLALYIALKLPQGNDYESYYIKLFQYLANLAKFDRDNVVRSHIQIISSHIKDFISDEGIDFDMQK